MAIIIYRLIIIDEELGQLRYSNLKIANHLQPQHAICEHSKEAIHNRFEHVPRAEQQTELMFLV